MSVCERCGDPIPSAEKAARFCGVRCAMATLQEREAAEKAAKLAGLPPVPPPDPIRLPSVVDDLEANVVGAILVAGALGPDCGHRLLDRIVATGLDALDFYRRSLGRIYHVMSAERELGHPLDALSLAWKLEREDYDPHVRGTLEALAHTCPAMANAPHWARLVAADARLRREAA